METLAPLMSPRAEVAGDDDADMIEKDQLPKLESAHCQAMLRGIDLPTSTRIQTRSTPATHHPPPFLPPHSVMPLLSRAYDFE